VRVHPSIFVLVSLAGCGAQQATAPPGIFFPTFELGGDVPAGIIEGSLAEQDGCLFVTSHFERWLLLWPDGYSAKRTGDAIEVLSEDGRVIGNTGDRIRLGGGEARPREVGGVAAADAWATELTGQNAPDRCGHQYWLATGPA
jgi:hypothetical protein